MTFISSSAALAISGIFSLAAIVVSLYLIFQHLRNYTKPLLQRPIVRILIIVPIYALSSWLSLMVPKASAYFGIIRDCYEAYVVYLFLALIVNYCGGDSACATELSRMGSMPHPWPCCFLRPVPLGKNFLRWCKQGTLQFVIMKPVMGLISFGMLAAGKYESLAYQWILTIIYNIAYTVALLALGYFYFGTRSLLVHYNPVRKFGAVKGVVFLTYWQSLIVTALPIEHDEGVRWSDFILCLEMLGFAILHLYAFSYTEFAVDRTPYTTVSGMGDNIMHVLSPKDVVQDARTHFSSRVLPIEEYRGIALLSEEASHRSADAADRFVRPVILDSPTSVEVSTPRSDASNSDHGRDSDGL